MNGLYLEDIEVGARYLSDAYVVTEDSIIAFAQQFDPQLFHLDPVAAEASVFQGLSASGWHTTAIAMRLFVNRSAAIRWRRGGPGRG